MATETRPATDNQPDGPLSASGSYRVILADPPWNHYNGLNYRGGRYHRMKREHYQTMSALAIAQLPVRAMAADNAALFMWAVMSRLPDALAVMEAWGFRYATTAFAWTKTNRDGSPFMSLGQYTRQNTEICLLGIRGRVLRKARNVSQVILAQRREHSRKPDIQYPRIMRLFDGPYLELFARQRWPGWDVWGNQTDLFPAQTFLFDEVAI